MEQQLEQPAHVRHSLGIGEWFRRSTGLLKGRHQLPVAPAAAAIAPGGRTNGTAGLSPRELDVLQLLPRGMTNQQIARELVVSEPTVATHVRHILQKTGAANRAEAAAYAVRHQLD